MAIVTEPGGPGKLYSFNGVPGATGRGRLLEALTVVIPDSTYVQVLGANSRRCWALVSNRNASAILVFLGNQTTAYITLTQYASLQLDNQLPWAGELVVYQTSGVPVTIDTVDAMVSQ